MRPVKPLIYSFALSIFLFSNLGLHPQKTQALAPQVAAAAEANISFQPFLTGLAQPLLVTNARDGSRRLFIAERNGVVKVLQYGESQPTVFLDISAKVLADRLGGFVGLAFHPEHRSNGRFFVHYVRRGDAAVVTAEYKVLDANPNLADPGSEQVLILQPKDKDGHCGGSIEFGPDGYLYIGLGDGSTGNDPNNNAQNLDTLLGKILRIDVDHTSDGKPYASPSTNPFFGAPAGRDEIFAYGFRNPYRFAFDRSTGELFVGEVGETKHEEVNIVRPGENYGWRVIEGAECTKLDAPLCDSLRSVAAVAGYDHTEHRCSITGGYVYRGPRDTLPQGAFIFGDLCSGEIWSYQDGRQNLLYDSDINNLFLVSFGEDEEGELYVVSLNGTVYKIVNRSAEEPQVQLLSPNINMKLRGNSVYSITWKTIGTGIYRHDIQWSTDGGASWQDITSGLSADTNSFEWRVPNIQTKKARVRVISFGSLTTGQDESDTNFKIKSR